MCYNDRRTVNLDDFYERTLEMADRNNTQTTEKRGGFGSKIGFILAAAGSAVGLGNIWRFPYLAAKYGGGIFLLVYIIFAVTFGFTLMITEIAIGRKTGKSVIGAYRDVDKRFAPLGWLAAAVPALILPYYCVIGGWVVKYFIAFVSGQGLAAAGDGYFGGFITAQYQPIILMVIFLAICAIVIFKGVQGGIEKFSKFIMPILLIMVIAISIFSLTIKHTDAAGHTVTGLQGLKVYFIPRLEGIGVKEFFYVVMDAMGQLFYSLSIAMGIMVAYGSYVPDKSNLVKSINQIEIFDTAVAILAGIMIIPAVFVFMGEEGMSAGPSLVFVSLPKIFAAMGKIGNVVGAVFFAMLLFAAITSAMSILEAIVSSLMDKFGMSRTKATWIETIIACVIGIIVCLGYNVFYFEYTLPNGATAQILDIFDYISNNILMPVVAFTTCILIGWRVKPKTIIEEATKNGERFGRKTLYVIMIKFIAPILLAILFLMSLGIL